MLRIFREEHLHYVKNKDSDRDSGKNGGRLYGTRSTEIQWTEYAWLEEFRMTPAILSWRQNKETQKIKYLLYKRTDNSSFTAAYLVLTQ